MKIAIVGHRLAPDAPSGVDRYLRGVVHGLASKGVELVVAAPTEPGSPDWLPPGVVARRIPGPRKLTNLVLTATRRPRIDRFVDGADLIHVAVPITPIPSSAPVIYTVHDLMHFTHPEWFSRHARWGFSEAMKDAAARAAVLVADSPHTAEEVRVRLGVAPDRVEVVLPGIDDRFLAGPQPGADVVAARSIGLEPGAFHLYVGQVNDRKNLLVLVRALARLKDPLPLVLAGAPGPGAERIDEEAVSLGVAHLIRRIGYLDDALLPGMLAAASTLLHPSYYEGFGLTPIEAMALGTPAVAASTSALPGTVGNAALLASPDDPDAWAEAISSLEEPAFRTSMIERGRARAATFTWSATADALTTVYTRVLG